MMHSAPVPLTVVIPSFNQGRWLGECLNSVLSQTSSRDEIVVMDGGSTDDSPAIIERAAKYLTYWQSKPDGGQSAAINAGLRMTRNSWVTWLNSDDYFLPGALDAIRNATATPGDVIYGSHAVVDSEGRTMERRRPPKWHNWVALRIGMPIPQPGTFFSRRAWRQSGGIDESLQCAFDLDFFFRLACAGYSFLRLNRELAAFRKHADAKGASWLKRYATETEELTRRFPTLRAPQYERWLARGMHVTEQALTGNYAWALGWNILLRGTPRGFQHPKNVPQDSRQDAIPGAEP